MNEMFKILRRNISEIPDLSKNGYHVRSLFANRNKSLITIGASYEDFPSPKIFTKEQFYLLTESFQNTKKFENMFTKKYGKYKITNKHIPKFKLIENQIKNHAFRLSWLKENKIKTLISMNFCEEELKRKIKIIENSEIIGDSFYRQLKNLPNSVESWKLKTVFVWVDSVKPKNGFNKMFKKIQGNFKKNNSFINVKVSVNASSTLKNIYNVFIKNNIVKTWTQINKYIIRWKFENFEGEKLVKAFTFNDPERNIILFVHNNRTSQYKDVEKDLKLLLKRTIENFGENLYECFSTI